MLIIAIKFRPRAGTERVPDEAIFAAFRNLACHVCKMLIIVIKCRPRAGSEYSTHSVPGDARFAEFRHDACHV